MGTDIVSDGGEDSGDFALLVELQLAYAVVCFDGFCRLDKHGLSCRRNVVDDAVYAPFVACRHGHDEPSVADYGGGVVVDDAFLTATGDNASHNPVD